MAENKRKRSRKRRKVVPLQDSLKFPQAEGRTVAEVRLRALSDEYSIAIEFQDRTSLYFNIEPCVSVAPEFGMVTEAGSWRRLKAWRPVQSPSSQF